MENFVKNQFSKNEIEEADFKSDVRKSIDGVREDSNRVHNAHDELDQAFAGFKGDCRARLTALENAILGGGGGGGSKVGGGGEGGKSV